MEGGGVCTERESGDHGNYARGGCDQKLIPVPDEERRRRIGLRQDPPGALAAEAGGRDDLEAAGKPVGAKTGYCGFAVGTQGECDRLLSVVQLGAGAVAGECHLDFRRNRTRMAVTYLDLDSLLKGRLDAARRVVGAQQAKAHCQIGRRRGLGRRLLGPGPGWSSAAQETCEQDR